MGKQEKISSKNVQVWGLKNIFNIEISYIIYIVPYLFFFLFFDK